ncbi:synaptonemal complex central element protein 2 [Esox lucius]|uniref:Synaptonemal complex central element protein 2 n=1 Tax=Esox lucius TaxID=8010 RepID=A0A3P8Y0D8_ESOLU|nr:synaptonemal complex central element protein 2 [Esox lucius]
MSQLIYGKSVSTFQSKLKSGDHPSPAQDPDKVTNDDTSEETLSFVTLQDSNGQQSEDSGINISNSLDGGDLRCMSSEETTSLALSSSIEEIGKKAQDLIERINQSRAMDQEIMTSFDNKLINKVSEVCQQIKEQMFRSYDEHSCGMEANLLELSEVLERSSRLSMELQEASQTLSAINNSLQKAVEQ